MQRRDGVAPRELQTPPAPALLQHLLPLYRELATSRQGRFNGPLPLAWSELLAWASLTATPVSPWEARLLRALDMVWIDVWQSVQPPRPDQPPPPTRGQRPPTRTRR